MSNDPNNGWASFGGIPSMADPALKPAPNELSPSFVDGNPPVYAGRSSTPVTAVGAIVRDAVEGGGRTSPDITIELTVDLDDVVALLTVDEQFCAGGLTTGHNLVFAVGFTSGGVLIGGNNVRFPEGQLLNRVGIPDGVRAIFRSLAMRYRGL